MGTRKGLAAHHDTYLHPSFLFLLVICISCLHLLTTHLFLNPSKSGFPPQQYCPAASSITKDLLITLPFDVPHHPFLQFLPSPGFHDTAARVFKDTFSNRNLLSNEILLGTPTDYHSFIVDLKSGRVSHQSLFFLKVDFAIHYISIEIFNQPGNCYQKIKLGCFIGIALSLNIT